MRTILQRFFTHLVRCGSLTVVDASGASFDFGDGSGRRHVLVLADADVERAIAIHPQLALGETYMEGRWRLRTGTLASFLELLMANEQSLPRSRLGSLARTALRRWHQRNSRRAARRNARHHYDVGNDVYRLFLDDDWQYSCAYFPREGVSLEDAQRAKKRHIAAKLLVEPGDRVLDIGSGWGGLALYLARHTGADVTGVTLADNQAMLARERAAGEPSVRFHLEDYRAVQGQFDRIVSVGMFEHVGLAYYDAFFAQCRRLLDDDGVMLLHSIGRTGVGGTTNPFIQRYIFPGGYIPAMSEVLSAIERSGLVATDIEVWRLHYAETLRHWGARFADNRAKVVRARGEAFARMWEFYLAGSEAAFRAGDMMVFQIQLARHQHAVPLTRDYMTSAEAALAARDAVRPTAPALVARHG
ncbi:class I SAM-dependent methyltransferase [Acuticoccus sp.]|uniref:class I SAM-dependent methyltransferase n=1 Tax=Acuticoccus sp. TaxID=1904378 RepID=UPI003B518929